MYTSHMPHHGAGRVTSFCRKSYPALHVNRPAPWPANLEIPQHGCLKLFQFDTTIS